MKLERLTALICGLLACQLQSVQGAFKDFVVEPEALESGEQSLALPEYPVDCDNEGFNGVGMDEQLLYFTDALQEDGSVSPELLAKLLMQHMLRLGLDVSQISNWRSMAGDWPKGAGEEQHEIGGMGCQADEYQYEPTNWRDIFFS